MRAKKVAYLKTKTFAVLCFIFMFPMLSIAQEDDVWKSLDSLDINYANSLFSEKDINSIVGIWESHNGVIFMIKDYCKDNTSTTYQMVMLKDRVFYGNWHKKIQCGKIVGVISSTANEKIFSCEFKGNAIKTKQFHLTFKDNKLVYTGSSSLNRKLFAVKTYPITLKKENKPISHTPLSKSKIKKEGTK